MDRLTPDHRSANMRRIKSTDTRPELAVRRLCHALGYRYRLHRKDLPGKPDLVFPSRRAVIFVHGCFWHQHPLDTCSDSRRPKSNASYWNKKLERNVERDRKVIRDLEQDGWRVLVIWECQSRDNGLATRITEFLDSR